MTTQDNKQQRENRGKAHNAGTARTHESGGNKTMKPTYEAMRKKSTEANNAKDFPKQGKEILK